jgi:hypothetical protein
MNYMQVCAKGYDVMLLPVVLGSAGTLLYALIVQQKRWTFPKLEKGTIQQASPTHYTRSTKPCVPTAIPGQTESNRRSKGKYTRKIAFLPTPICPTLSRLVALIFVIEFSQKGGGERGGVGRV